ncbi:MAG: hypothetical protein K0U66_07380, partial [Gammaproteobacteria bacterium]|nr:hypothetical protein [Gammaproteobacteria bacterium]
VRKGDSRASQQHPVSPLRRQSSKPLWVFLVIDNGIEISSTGFILFDSVREAVDVIGVAPKPVLLPAEFDIGFGLTLEHHRVGFDPFIPLCCVYDPTEVAFVLTPHKFLGFLWLVLSHYEVPPCLARMAT